jgi:hypothetical protein
MYPLGEVPLRAGRFLGTLLLGLIISYQVYLAYASGRTAGTYTAPASRTAGKGQPYPAPGLDHDRCRPSIVITVKNY